MWFLKYVMGLNPAAPQRYLILGTAYHALLEGKSPGEIARWGADFAEVLPEATELFKARTEKGPPLPKATAIEKELRISSIPMTSKPDREEPNRVVRDFKTTSVRSKDDDAFWSVNGEIIGEMLAADATTCIVDIVNKNDGKTTQLEVTQSPEKIRALEELVEDLIEELNVRLHRARKMGGLSAIFPKRMTSCVGKYGRCHYYDRCWSGGAARLLYKKSPNNGRWIPMLTPEGSAYGADMQVTLTPEDIKAIAMKAIAEGL